MALVSQMIKKEREKGANSKMSANSDENNNDGGDQHMIMDDDNVSASSSSSDSDSDDSSLGSEMEEEAQRLMDALEGVGRGPLANNTEREATKPPQEVWAEYIRGLETNTNASLKVNDTLIAWVAETPSEEERIVLTDALCNDLIRAVQDAFVIIHVILGRVFLSLLSPAQQQQLYRAILTKHAPNITYWKFGSDDSTDECRIATTELLKSMTFVDMELVNNHHGYNDRSIEWTNLTELEIRGLKVTDVAQLELLLSFLHKAPKIRQFNLLGMVMSDDLVATEGIFDKLVTTVQAISGFDELQLCRRVINKEVKKDVVEKNSSNQELSSPPLISPAVLQKLFQVKPKWWRMALDGMSLDDRHVEVLSFALKGSNDCKMNDLLSLRDNPKISHKGLHTLYTVCLSKQRMGLVLSDDPTWVATFDLVRPLNNLHRRLEYLKNDGRGYRSREAWIDWLTTLGNLPWIEESRKTNYIWFALLEQPDLITQRGA